MEVSLIVIIKARSQVQVSLIVIIKSGKALLSPVETYSDTVFLNEIYKATSDVRIHLREMSVVKIIVKYGIESFTFAKDTE